MTDLTYLNKINLRDEARYFFEQDFPDIAKDFNIGSDGNKVYGDIYKKYFDPYRHIYGSAVLTREFGSSFSKVLGDLNEVDLFGFRNNPTLEKNQDLWNNAIGREIGSDNPGGRLIADRIKAAFENGDAIIDHTTDQRTYVGEVKCYVLDTADSFSQLLEKYSLNPNISDYSNSIPTLIINDGNGNNFNLAALPDFSYLSEAEQITAFDQFTTNFLDTALADLNIDLTNFEQFLNDNQVSYHDFSNEISSSLNLDNYQFSDSFDRYFSNNLLNNLNLDSNLFEVSTTINNGFLRTEYQINANDLSINHNNSEPTQISSTQYFDLELDDTSLDDYLSDAGYINIEYLDDYLSFDFNNLYEIFGNQLENDQQDLKNIVTKIAIREILVSPAFVRISQELNGVFNNSEELSN